MPEGVVFCLKQRKKHQKDQHHNPIAPYFLIYVDIEGNLVFNFTQSKKVLDVYQKLASAEAEVFKELVDVFQAETKKGKRMDDYIALLENAVQEIIGKNEEKGIASLFTTGGTTSVNDELRSLDDFEVISYLVVKN